MTKNFFKVSAPFAPTGDQPQAIENLADGLENGLVSQVLLGATGNSFTAAQKIRTAQEV